MHRVFETTLTRPCTSSVLKYVHIVVFLLKTTYLSSSFVTGTELSRAPPEIVILYLETKFTLAYILCDDDNTIINRRVTRSAIWNYVSIYNSTTSFYTTVQLLGSLGKNHIFTKFLSNCYRDLLGKGEVNTGIIDPMIAIKYC